MKLNDYVVKSNLEEVAHSSGYAKAQSGRRFGAASTQSFSQRQAVDYRKSRIRSYGDSKLGQLRMAQKTKMESSMTALDQIRQKRIERENNDYMFNSNRQKNTVTGDQIDRATRMRMEARGEWIAKIDSIMFPSREWLVFMALLKSHNPRKILQKVFSQKLNQNFKA